MNLEKLFAIKKPCKDCPFLDEPDMRHSLAEGRIESIIEALEDDKPFHCHKTVNYSYSYDEENAAAMVADASYCAGSLLYMEKTGNRPIHMRLGIAFGLYDPKALSGHDLIIKPLGGR
jgi:hypothetical protein